MVGPWPAPSAVLIFCLYASFWKNVAVILVLGLALLTRSMAACRIGWPGGPDSDQYVAAPPPPLPPPEAPVLSLGPELPHAARPAAAGPPAGGRPGGGRGAGAEAEEPAAGE